MYPSLGEHTSYNDDERVPYAYQMGSNMTFHQEMEAEFHHQLQAQQEAGFQQLEKEDEVPKPTKMFWHAYHIDTVQPLVPEEVR